MVARRCYEDERKVTLSERSVGAGELLRQRSKSQVRRPPDLRPSGAALRPLHTLMPKLITPKQLMPVGAAWEYHRSLRYAFAPPRDDIAFTTFEDPGVKKSQALSGASRSDALNVILRSEATKDPWDPRAAP